MCICIDYKKINSITCIDDLPLPFIDQMSEGSARHNVILLMDYSGYNQIVIAPEDQEKTIFTFPFGTFACRRMPFGLCNALATFHRCMINTFSDYVENIIQVFMDDFNVNGISSDKCLGNIILVLKWCMETNLVLILGKCHFIVD